MDASQNTCKDNIRPVRNPSRRVIENEEAAADSGGRVIKLILVSFGLLCITQATLNIVLRLYLTQDQPLPGLNSTCENVTADSTELQKILNKLQNLKLYADQGWRYFRGSLYLCPTQHLSWKDSRKFCHQTGSHLIIINDIKEQEFAVSLGGRRWIGLSDVETEGVWKWVDGTQLSTSFWLPGEPNNENGNEDCVETIHFNTNNTWNDEACSEERHFICEMELT